MSETSQSSYQLAPGYENQTFVHESYGKAITAANLTDEAAEFFIEHGYGHAFLSKPVAAASEPDEDKKPKLEKKADYQARFKELFGAEADDKLTIAQLTEHIDAKESDAAYELPAA